MGTRGSGEKLKDDETVDGIMAALEQRVDGGYSRNSLAAGFADDVQEALRRSGRVVQAQEGVVTVTGLGHASVGAIVGFYDDRLAEVELAEGASPEDAGLVARGWCVQLEERSVRVAILDSRDSRSGYGRPGVRMGMRAETDGDPVSTDLGVLFASITSGAGVGVGQGKRPESAIEAATAAAFARARGGSGTCEKGVQEARAGDETEGEQERAHVPVVVMDALGRERRAPVDYVAEAARRAGAVLSGVEMAAAAAAGIASGSGSGSWRQDESAAAATVVGPAVVSPLRGVATSAVPGITSRERITRALHSGFAVVDTFASVGCGTRVA